jgi:hypothetical protein
VVPSVGTARLVCAITKGAQAVSRMDYMEDTMSKDDAEVLHSWQRSQVTTVVSMATVLGEFLGIAELAERGLATPEHTMQQVIRIAREYKESK